tara:strand:- start:1024 stop:2082 length:1059 start_codon:yes stop_codon:yes gene_type:complete
VENIDYFIKQLEKANYFEKIDKSKISKLNKYNIFYSVREDGFSQRILNYIYTLRISKKLNKKTILLWDTSKESSGVIQHNLNDEDAKIFQNLPIIKFNSNFERFYKLSRGGAIQDNFFYDSKILYFEGENLRDVILEISEIYKSLELNEDIKKIVKKIDQYEYGIHIRGGDMSITEVNLGQGNWRWHTRNRLSINKCFPKESYIKIIEQVRPSNVFVCSSSQDFVKDLSQLDNVITLEKSFENEKLSSTEKFILDIHSLSKCKNLICAFESGSTLMAIFLRVNSKNITPIDFLKINGIYEELSNIIKSQFRILNSPKQMVKRIINIYSSRLYLQFIERYFKRFLKKKIKFKD